MTLTPLESVAVILVCAVATFATRALPHLLFNEKRRVPPIIEYLGEILPPAIIAVLVIYCLKDVSFLSGNHGLPEIISIVVVITLHWWKNNTLLSIGGGTVLYMILIRFI